MRLQLRLRQSGSALSKIIGYVTVAGCHCCRAMALKIVFFLSEFSEIFFAFKKELASSWIFLFFRFYVLRVLHDEGV